MFTLRRRKMSSCHSQCQCETPKTINQWVPFVCKPKRRNKLCLILSMTKWFDLSPRCSLSLRAPHFVTLNDSRIDGETSAPLLPICQLTCCMCCVIDLSCTCMLCIWKPDSSEGYQTAPVGFNATIQDYT